MEQKDQHSLGWIKNSKEITEEQRFSVERHQTKNPGETEDREDDHSGFYPRPNLYYGMLLFHFVRIQHDTKNHNKHNGVDLEQIEKELRGWLKIDGNDCEEKKNNKEKTLKFA